MEELMENKKKLDNNTLQEINWDELSFNLYPTRSMYVASCKEYGEWSNGNLVPYGNINISPASGVLNYGQGVFEGVKVYRTINNKIVFFRVEQNAKRFESSCNRLCIPPITNKIFMDAVYEVIMDNIDFVPPCGKGSLYVRPVAWGTGPVLGVKPAPSYTFLVFVSPVGPYFKEGVRPLNLIITDQFHRAAPKGIGDAKAIGNYSASLLPREIAVKQGYDEVIYLNASDENFVEEVGSANLFALEGNVLKTPKLAGSILPGVTRDSVLLIAKEKLGLQIQEKNLSVDEIINADEVFCTGTAVVVTPIGRIATKYSENIIGDGKMGLITSKLRETILNIQDGKIDDEFGWLTEIK